MKLAPNRVTLYLTAAVDITGGLVAVVGDLDSSQTGGLAAALVSLNALAAMFLRGWQQYESAIYQSDLIGMQHAAHQERQAAAVQQAMAQSAPRGQGIVRPPR